VQRSELFVGDATFPAVAVEEHHGGLVVDRPLQIVSRLHLHEAYAAVADGMVAAEAVYF
jgi:hypothetical protein